MSRLQTMEEVLQELSPDSPKHKLVTNAMRLIRQLESEFEGLSLATAILVVPSLCDILYSTMITYSEQLEGEDEATYKGEGVFFLVQWQDALAVLSSVLNRAVERAALLAYKPKDGKADA